MITIKSEHEIELMRQAGLMVSKTHKYLKDFIKPGITTKELLNATDMAIKMKQDGVLGKPCPDYVDETVSMKVVRIIQGYVNVVNKMVWRKDK